MHTFYPKEGVYYQHRVGKYKTTSAANNKENSSGVTVSLICPVNTAETHFFTEQLAKYDLIFYWNNGQFQFWGVVLVLFLGFS